MRISGVKRHGVFADWEVDRCRRCDYCDTVTCVEVLAGRTRWRTSRRATTTGAARVQSGHIGGTTVCASEASAASRWGTGDEGALTTGQVLAGGRVAVKRAYDSG